MYGIIVSALVAALVTMGLTPLVRRLAQKWGAIDQPEARRINKAPLPRAGGIAIFLGILVAILFTVTVRQFSRSGQHTWNPQVVGVLLAMSFIAVTGLIDDLKNLSAKWQAL